MKIKAQIDRMVGENNRIKAYASVILGGEYVVRDIAVMDSKNGLFARMPYRSYKDILLVKSTRFPINFSGFCFRFLPAKAGTLVCNS